MKKLFLAFFLIAFISVSFSATASPPIKEETKKEFVKNSEVVITSTVFVDTTFDVDSVKQPNMLVFKRINPWLYKHELLSKTYLKLESLNHDNYNGDWFTLKESPYKYFQKKNISG